MSVLSKPLQIGTDHDDAQEIRGTEMVPRANTSAEEQKRKCIGTKEGDGGVG